MTGTVFALDNTFVKKIVLLYFVIIIILVILVTIAYQKRITVVLPYIGLITFGKTYPDLNHLLTARVVTIEQTQENSVLAVSYNQSTRKFLLTPLTTYYSVKKDRITEATKSDIVTNVEVNILWARMNDQDIAEKVYIYND